MGNLKLTPKQEWEASLLHFEPASLEIEASAVLIFSQWKVAVETKANLTYDGSTTDTPERALWEKVIKNFSRALAQLELANEALQDIQAGSR